MRIRRALWALAFLAAGVVVGLAAINVIDWWRYRSAVGRIDRLTEPELQAMAAYARALEGHKNFRADQTPVAFAFLKPVRGSFGKRLTDLTLYESGDAAVWMRIDTSGSDQVVTVINWVRGRDQRVIWRSGSQSEKMRRIAPFGRKLTVSVTSGNTLEWIILSDRMLVVARSGEPDDVLLADGPLDAASVQRIERAAGMIPKERRGNAYEAAGVFDGDTLDLCFGPDGERDSTAIVLANVWLEELKPVLDAVTDCAPKEFPVNYEKRVASDRDLARKRIVVRSFAERDRAFFGQPKTPWWCLWH